MLLTGSGDVSSRISAPACERWPGRVVYSTTGLSHDLQMRVVLGCGGVAADRPGSSVSHGPRRYEKPPPLPTVTQLCDRPRQDARAAGGRLSPAAIIPRLRASQPCIPTDPIKLRAHPIHSSLHRHVHTMSREPPTARQSPHHAPGHCSEPQQATTPKKARASPTSKEGLRQQPPLITHGEIDARSFSVIDHPLRWRRRMHRRRA